ncbi:hypothetical protein FW778_01770 [Ginsengibacter hankyongi]|uniref:Uncharacterized protein n=1 Tax=Ginsengibacter hankyongi TaxID=2607284 RepID=A0A5J5IIC7_9BACT|nr:hypothetical protein [Ginsengibacter hankyongi]KAA9040795.1 hypothetical protein FW778_01770 [Ginsengibacter hankyongi]
MKKIITLLFFAGCLSTSFAQSGHRRQTNQPNGNGYQSNQNSENNTDQYSQNSGYGNGGYSNNQRNNRNTENNYGYNNDRDSQDRGDMRRDQHGYSRDNQRGWEDRSYRSWNRESRHHRMYRDDDRD